MNTPIIFLINLCFILTFQVLAQQLKSAFKVNVITDVIDVKRKNSVILTL